jgi:hypothetical protein
MCLAFDFTVQICDEPRADLLTAVFDIVGAPTRRVKIPANSNIQEKL